MREATPTVKIDLIESAMEIEGRTVPHFGLVAQGPEGEITVPHISPDRAAVQGLAARFLAADLSPLHLPDAVQDWLGDDKR